MSLRYTVLWGPRFDLYDWALAAAISWVCAQLILIQDAA